ncbi:hypothetical protein AHF37_07732 [Paragonimus kellicotti]|nr:hypothetical protein AHF37_07732 [Paragonimus kellicotti]
MAHVTEDVSFVASGKALKLVMESLLDQSPDDVKTLESLQLVASTVPHLVEDSLVVKLNEMTGSHLLSSWLARVLIWLDFLLAGVGVGFCLPVATACSFLNLLYCFLWASQSETKLHPATRRYDYDSPYLWVSEPFATS